jgi:hypothetical protein
MRTLTIVVDFDETKPPKWIWACHAKGKSCNGVYVTAIAEGWQLKDIEENEEEE